MVIYAKSFCEVTTMAVNSNKMRQWNFQFSKIEFARKASNLPIFNIRTIFLMIQINFWAISLLRTRQLQIGNSNQKCTPFLKGHAPKSILCFLSVEVLLCALEKMAFKGQKTVFKTNRTIFFKLRYNNTHVKRNFLNKKFERFRDSVNVF